MMQSTHLVAECNRYLDERGRSGVHYGKLDEHERKLREFKDRMLFMGFDKPFAGLLAVTKKEILDLSPEESVDLTKQLERIRDLANMKRWTLSRVRIALAASRLMRELLKMKDSSKLIEFVPVDGNHIRPLVEAGEHGIYAYRELFDILGQKVEETLVVIAQIEYKKDGKTEKASVRFEGGERSMEKSVKRIYGRDARIVGSRVAYASRPLIKRRSARVCMAVAYAALASKLTKPAEEQGLGDYKRLMKKYGLSWSARIDQVDGYEELKKELATAGMMVEEQGSQRLKPEIVTALNAQRNRLYDACTAKAMELLALDVFRNMLMAKREREKSVFAIEPKSEKQLAFLDSLSALGLENAAGLAWKKLSAEEFQDVSGVSGEEFGAAFVYLNSSNSLEWCEERLGVSAGNTRKAALAIAKFVEARKEKLDELGIEESEKVRKFAELVRDAGSERK